MAVSFNFSHGRYSQGQIAGRVGKDAPLNVPKPFFADFPRALRMYGYYRHIPFMKDLQLALQCVVHP